MAEWRELVERGIAASHQLSGAQWVLGDLALEVEPMGEDHARTGSYARLERYAQLIDVSMPALLGYRKVAAAWPDGTRVLSASWTVHRDAMGHRDLLRELAATHNRVTVAVLHDTLDRLSRSLTPQSEEPPPEFLRRQHAESTPASSRHPSSDGNDPRTGRDRSARHFSPSPLEPIPDDEPDRPTSRSDKPTRFDPSPFDEPQSSVPTLAHQLVSLIDQLVDGLPEYSSVELAGQVLPDLDHVEMALHTIRERLSGSDALDRELADLTKT